MTRRWRVDDQRSGPGGREGPEYLAWLRESPQGDYLLLIGASTFRLLYGTSGASDLRLARSTGHQCEVGAIVEQSNVDQALPAPAGEPGSVGIAEIRAVNIVYRVRDGHFHGTAIDKRPVRGPVDVTWSGMAGDRQLGSSHGGVDKAVYAYSDEDADWWADELSREIPSGLFGENLRTHGLATSGAVIGEQWSAGTAVFEVRMPRTPCENLALRMGIEKFHIRFNNTGRVGALLRVLQPGVVCAGDIVSVVDRPDHGVRVADLATGPDAVQMQRLLDAGIPLAKNVRAKAERIVRRAGP